MHKHMERKAATPARKRDRRAPARSGLLGDESEATGVRRRRRLVARPRKAPACSGMCCQVHIWVWIRISTNKS